MHPSYPARPLGKAWRAGYTRTARRLTGVAAGLLGFWLLVIWALHSTAV